MINSIGIIFCAYGNPNYIEPCLKPWLNLKQKYNIKIAGVHGQFKEYHENNIIDCDTETVSNLYRYFRYGNLDYLYVQNNYWGGSSDDWIFQTEAEIRNYGLRFLLNEKCDIIWFLDLDEFYTEEQVEKIIGYIYKNENFLNTWFSIPMKNYIFNGKQWIDGFCPPRIFKRECLHTTTLEIDSFYYDNDIKYKTKYNDPYIVDYKSLSNNSIPKNIINGGIKHLTWLHSNGKKKVEYQLTHFGHCSYKWNDEKKELEIDYDFYKKNGLEIPIIYRDE